MQHRFLCDHGFAPHNTTTINAILRYTPSEFRGQYNPLHRFCSEPGKRNRMPRGETQRQLLLRAEHAAAALAAAAPPGQAAPAAAAAAAVAGPSAPPDQRPDASRSPPPLSVPPPAPPAHGMSGAGLDEQALASYWTAHVLLQGYDDREYFSRSYPDIDRRRIK